MIMAHTISKISARKVILKTIAFLAFFIFCDSGVSAAKLKIDSSSENTEYRESLFPNKSRSLADSHFTWGAEVGTSIDMTGHDMSTFDLDALVGYKNSFLNIAGIGAGVHRAVQSGNNFVPIYAVIQTSFRKRPSLFFLNAKFGYSFNTIQDSPTFGDFVSALGVGLNLSKTRIARTYILLSVGYRYFNERHKVYVDKLTTHYVYMTHLSFGINF